MGSDDRAVFTEVQRMRQAWVWAVVCLVAFIAWYGFIKQIVLGGPFGTHPASDLVMWIVWILVGIGLPVFAWTIRLVTTVDDRGIHIRLPPFAQCTIRFSELKQIEIRRYRPIVDYWGWGARCSLRHGLAYTMMGDRGVQCELVGRTRVLIGTQVPEELAAAIQSQMDKPG